jgi:RNA polymerase sigma factor (sigma-70 family)
MIIKPLYEEAAILAKIAEGDEQAFKIVYDHYYRQVYSFAFKWIEDKESAQEIVQETMLFLWQLGYKLTEVRNVESYLKTIAKRKAIDVFRKKVLQEKSVRALATAYIDGHNERGTEHPGRRGKSTSRSAAASVQTLPDRRS